MASSSKQSSQTKRQASRQTEGEAAQPQPEDMDRLRISLARKLAIFVNRKQWPGCRLRACRRQRSCTAPGLVCANPAPPRITTPDHEARAMAYLRKELKRRLAALPGEGRG